MAKYTLNHVRLALDERKHLDMDHCQRQARLKTLSVSRERCTTSAGFFVRYVAFILANCEAITFCVFISSGSLSSTEFQKGTSSSLL